MNMKWSVGLTAVAGAMLLAGCAASDSPQPVAPDAPIAEVGITSTGALTATSRPSYDIVTLLPRDAIPAIFEPDFVAGFEADEQYEPNELVLGVEIDGEARAYSIPFLSGHEIVNDTVAGHPIAVTW